MDLRPELTRRLPVDAAESAIELGERLKTHVVGNLADAPVRVEQLRASCLRPDSRQMIGKLQSGALVKDLAKMEDTGAYGGGNREERDFFRLVLLDIAARLAHDRRLLILLLDEQLVAQSRKLFCEESQQPNNGVVTFSRNERVLLPGALQRGSKTGAGILQRPPGSVRINLARRTSEDLSDPQIADYFLAQLERHRRLGKAKRAGHRGRQISRVANHLGMSFEADGERLRILSEERAERIFVELPVMSELPILQRAQGERQPGCLREDTLIISEQFRAPQDIDQLPVLPGMNVIFGRSGHAKASDTVSALRQRVASFSA